MNTPMAADLPSKALAFWSNLGMMCDSHLSHNSPYNAINTVAMCITSVVCGFVSFKLKEQLGASLSRNLEG